ncbi:MAG: hypothetical protein K6A92_11940, partial [Lachnospiraceae bacterium]|nr:hypothetical protein [Lachnospiraceae bacterium]
MQQFINRIPKWIRATLKGLFITAAVLIVVGGILMALFIYEVRYKVTFVGREVSPDGEHNVLFQAVGEPDFPFGASHGKITVYEGETKLTTFQEDISDDGGMFRPANYKVEWMPAGVVITFMGSEQADREVEVYFDGRDSFEGYSDEEITEILQQRYDIGNVDAILRNGEKLTIKADGITFCGTNHLALHETYRQEKFKAFTESIFGEHLYRGLSWKTEQGKEVTDITYIPIIGYNGAPGREDLEWFCDDICLWLEDCYAEYPYEEFGNLYHCIIPDLYGSEQDKYYFGDFPMRNFEEDESILYNELYHYLNDRLSKTGGQGDAGQIPADSGETDAAYDTA